MKIFELSSKTGEGMDEWLEFLKSDLTAKKEG
jgi:Ni2+-binding GTPase involved in maturation of urease and hydrogenase